MLDGSPVPEIPADDFVRRFSMRPGQLMWFLGAGVSASAGLPTAWDMIWRFKRDLYVAQRKLSAQTVRSEEHTSELQSLMRISYAVFCLKKKTNTHDQRHHRYKDEPHS